MNHIYLLVTTYETKEGDGNTLVVYDCRGRSRQLRSHGGASWKSISKNHTKVGVV